MAFSLGGFRHTGGVLGGALGLLKRIASLVGGTLGVLATTLVFLLWMRGHLAELMGGKGQKKNKGMESGE